MNKSPIPQGPWYNPRLEEGVYDAEIRCVTKGKYGPNKDTYLQFVFWLPAEKKYLVTNLYFPEDKPDNRSILRLQRLCRCIGRTPQDALDTPDEFQGEQLRITVKTMTGAHGNSRCEYSDVDLFFPADSKPAEIVTAV